MITLENSNITGPNRKYSLSITKVNIENLKLQGLNKDNSSN
jgi:hypothetical protein